MHSIFTYIWLIFMVNVGKYTIHGSSGIHMSYKNYFPLNPGCLVVVLIMVLL